MTVRLSAKDKQPIKGTIFAVCSIETLLYLPKKCAAMLKKLAKYHQRTIWFNGTLSFYALFKHSKVKTSVGQNTSENFACNFVSEIFMAVDNFCEVLQFVIRAFWFLFHANIRSARSMPKYIVFSNWFYGIDYISYATARFFIIRRYSYRSSLKRNFMDVRQCKQNSQFTSRQNIRWPFICFDHLSV